MSVQAGIWNFDGKPIDRTLLGQFSEALKQQGPDGEFCHMDGSIALLYRPFHTTAESRREKQPYVSRRGFVITWDGRLDNREELAIELHDEVTADATDVDLFGGAFDRWESECFRRIIGDWAVSIWKPKERELILACDFMAIRHIFYYLKDDRIWWSTDLTPLVLLSGDKFRIDDEYVAGYFAHDPDVHLTPYREIREVPAGQFVRVRNGTSLVERFWRFAPESRIRYKTDAEYEEHFRYIFRQSVRRRLRSDSPILAELSGGLDSSSIVCMADDILSHGGNQTPRLDTFSTQDKGEPHGDDWMYFPIVESKRGRVGAHLDTSTLTCASSIFQFSEFFPLPGYLISERAVEVARAAVLARGNNRAVLSGIGGDEFMGGIPNPTAHLADLVVQFRLLEFGRSLLSWSLAKRLSLLRLLSQVLVNLLPVAASQYFAKQARVEPWIERHFAKRNKLRRRLLDVNDHFGFWLPTRRSYIGGVMAMSNKSAKWTSSTVGLEEIRYPYLDQTLIEYVLSIPAEQLLRPGERRSLMRRALRDIVPDAILSRRTKQLGYRTPLIAFHEALPLLQKTFGAALCAHFGYVNSERFLAELHAAEHSKQIHIVRMLRTISLELWLRDLASRGCIDAPRAFDSEPCSTSPIHTITSDPELFHRC
jgi:asparagine synthase (glutamine-hydrolysing)